MAFVLDLNEPLETWGDADDELGDSHEGWEAPNPSNGPDNSNGDAHENNDDHGDSSEDDHENNDHGDGSGDENENTEGHPKRRFYDNATCQAIYAMLLQESSPRRLKRDMSKSVAVHFLVPLRVVQRIWTEGKHEGEIARVRNKKTGNCGRKRVQIELQSIRDVPLQSRTTLSDLGKVLNVNPSTLYKRLKEEEIVRHTNQIKFSLTDENKKARLQYCLSNLDSSSIPHDPVFKAMYNVVFINKKWFYMTKKCRNYYLARDEEVPLRDTRNKNFIDKVIFLVAIACPRFDAAGNETFLGKIGVFPFNVTKPARRRSVNRPAGTMVTKPITSVTKDISHSFLVDKVVPAIKEKWPRENLMHLIFIQQNNAKTHIDPNDAEFYQVATQDGFGIRLMCQPPNSPDLNVLDLGFFAAIQSIQHKSSSKKVVELVSAVVKTFEDYPTVKSNRVFLNHQSCMKEIMRQRGGQKYDIPHMNKDQLERNGQLPSKLRCEPELVEEVRNFLE